MAKRILVVDDEIESLKLIGLMLQRRGYEIIAARSGTQALEKVKTGDPDLVILDIMMPDMDGYEVCRRIRADPTTSDLPIIMFTAKSMVNDKVAGFQVGADDYLTKPVHPDELASRIEAVLARSKRKRAEEVTPVRAKIIAFLGSKGGVGITTLAVNTAVVLAQSLAKDKRIILADLQAGMATVALQLGLRSNVGLSKILEQSAGSTIEGKTIESQLQEYMSGLSVLCGQVKPPGTALPLLPDQAEAIVRHLGSISDYLILDLGVGLGDVNRRILPHCEVVIVGIEPHRWSLALAQPLLEELNVSLGIPRHRIVLTLINKTPSSSTLTKDAIEKLLQHEITTVITPAPEAAFQAGETGKPMVQMHPTSLVAQQIRALAEHLAK
ncbi:MAG: response regulator [Anaerolineae bacterium]|nr:response regulator [Anaerolineae bacterium]